VSPEAVDKFSKKHFVEYTPEEKAVLGQRYSKEQMAALEAGEASIDPRDLTIQGQFRNDPGRMLYLDDFSTIQPVIDLRPKPPPPPPDAFRNLDFMSPSEFSDDIIQWASTKELDFEGLDDDEFRRRLEALKIDESFFQPSKPEFQEFQRDDSRAASEEDNITTLEDVRFWRERSTLKGRADPGATAFAPSLGDDIAGVTEYYKRSVEDSDAHQDPEGEYDQIKKLTGMTLREVVRTPAKILVTRWVHNQTRLGKIRRVSIMAVAGNRDGRLGLGVAKSTDAQVASKMAVLSAIRNQLPIVRYENRTIFGNVEAKVSGTSVQLFSRPPGKGPPLPHPSRRSREAVPVGHDPRPVFADGRPGFGLRVPHRIFEICRMCGISDLAAKIPRSRNPMNTVKATIKALQNQPNPEDIAMGRGKKLVDVRKVYYGGQVY